MRLRPLGLPVLVVVVTRFAGGPLAAQTSGGMEAALEGLSWRSIGPADMGGRTVDIAGIPGDPTTVYMATASGGLWKTTTGGNTWASIFTTGGTLSLGAVAVAPSDHNVVYLGTGENNPRNSTSIGDGVYRSTDAGKTWTHLGLARTERTGRIRVHPDDPDIAWVAALGHAWGGNEERGVFKTTDGGVTWRKVLYVDENTGAADLALDPGNSRILYAAMWDYRRQPWHFRSGGPGGGLYRSADGGETWTLLTDSAHANGLPSGTLGRIGVAVAAADPNVVYAVIESDDDGVLWRSDDRGFTWRVASTETNINNRPFYYSDLRVDPTDANRVYVLSGRLSVSDDAGRTWRRLGANMHGDHQSLWIDPINPDRLVNGNDGGFHFSYDRGATWEFINTVPLSQFYQIGVDMRDPYYVCGGLQDNDAWCGPSKTRRVVGPRRADWYEVIGPGDGMYVQIDPTDHTVMYANSQGGSIFRFDLETGEARAIRPYPVTLGGSAAGDHPYRFNCWNAPIHMSPHDPRTVFFGGNVLFRTRDGGQTWDEISPDLTRNDTLKQRSSGGPLTPDNTSAEYHGTIYTVAESPVQAGVLWVGTDDGNLHMSPDGGATWTNLIERVPDLPDPAWVSRIEASRHDAGTAYVAFDRHRSDDMTPYVYMTEDSGRSWARITGDLPPLHYVHVVREDPRNPNLLYVGTELGAFASWDRGETWLSLRLGLTRVAVRDMLVHPRDNDLVIGTHGRGIFVLDDIAPLQMMDEAVTEDAVFFPVRDAVRFRPWASRFRFDLADKIFVAENPPYGARLTYYIGGENNGAGGPDRGTPADSTMLRFTVLDQRGDTVRVLEAPAGPGTHRVAWDLRYGVTEDDEEEGYSPNLAAPEVLPAEYRIVMSVDSNDYEQTVRVRMDSRIQAGPRALADQHRVLMALWERSRDGVTLVRRLDDVKQQLEQLVEDGETDSIAVADSARAIVERIEGMRNGLVQQPGSGAKLLDKMRSLSGNIGRATFAPTAAQAEWATTFSEELRQIEARFDSEVAVAVGQLNEQIIRRVRRRK